MKANYIATATLIAVLGLGMIPLQSNAQTSHPRPHEINKRLAHQQARIHQGIKSKQLTRRESKQVRLAEARIHAQEHRDRIIHNGHLTKAETRHLNHELNHESKVIYRDKHNNHVR